MKSIVLFGCASVALAASAVSAGAQTQPMPPPAPPVVQQEQPAPSERAAPAAERSGPTDNQIVDEVDARVAQLKATLRLTTDQDGKWGALRDALRDDGIASAKRRYAADERMSRFERRGRRDQTDADASVEQDRRTNDIAMMRAEADDMATRAGALKKIADAAEPLYESLSDRQRRILLRFIERGFDRGER